MRQLENTSFTSRSIEAEGRSVDDTELEFDLSPYGWQSFADTVTVWLQVRTTYLLSTAGLFALISFTMDQVSLNNNWYSPSLLPFTFYG